MRATCRIDDAFAREVDRLVTERRVAHELTDGLLNEVVALDLLAESKEPNGVLARHAAAPEHLSRMPMNAHALEPPLELAQIDVVLVQRHGGVDQHFGRVEPGHGVTMHRAQHAVNDLVRLRDRNGLAALGGGIAERTERCRRFRDDFALNAPDRVAGPNVAVRRADAQRP